MSSLFELDDYKAAIRLQIEANRGVRAYRTALAKAAGIQLAYLSQILSAEKTNLNLDQAANLCDFWHYNELESEYFLTLVMHQRAGGPALSKRLRNKLFRLRKMQKQDELTYGEPSLTDWEKASRYYSTWLPAAIHVLLTVPRLQRSDDLAKHLQLPQSSVEKALSSLAEMGMVVHSFDRWIATERSLHAGSDSMFADLHHRNWRNRVAETLLPGESTSLHYTALHSLSRPDFAKIDSLLRETISKTRKLARDSKEEIGACLLIDWLLI